MTESRIGESAKLKRFMRVRRTKFRNGAFPTIYLGASRQRSNSTPAVHVAGEAAKHGPHIRILVFGYFLPRVGCEFGELDATHRRTRHLCLRQVNIFPTPMQNVRPCFYWWGTTNRTRWSESICNGRIVHVILQRVIPIIIPSSYAIWNSV
jgi:hypothetical protein